jgi:hypothetical protein
MSRLRMRRSIPPLRNICTAWCVVRELQKLRSMCETAFDITFINGEKNNSNQEMNIKIRKQIKNAFTKH